jgi:ankyrin repeat protein
MVMQRKQEDAQTHFDVCLALIRGKANVNAVPDWCGETALGIASMHNTVPLCLALVQAKADIEATGGSRLKTPLIYAAQNNHLPTVRVLLDLGAKVDGRDRHERTALINASAPSNVEVMRYLLDHNADPNAEQESGLTALQYVAAHPTKGDAEACTLLLERKALMDRTDRLGQSPLSMAKKQGNTVALQTMLRWRKKHPARCGRHRSESQGERCNQGQSGCCESSQRHCGNGRRAQGRASC